MNGTASERCSAICNNVAIRLIGYGLLRRESGWDMTESGRIMKRLAERAEIELKDACHIFRRTFAANAVKQSIPRPYVQAIAGWSMPQMLDHYVAAMEAEEEAIEAFREFKPFGR